MIQQRVRRTHDEFVLLLKEIQPNLEVVGKYYRSDARILVSDEFGICSTIPEALLYGKKPSIRTAINPSAYFSKRAIKTHGLRYDYSKVKYIDSRTEVCIVCSMHGDFPQRPSHHILGRGCPVCNFEMTGWGKSNFNKAANGCECILYKIHCWNKTESFYKIGRTKNTVERRFHNKKSMPYNYEIISEIKGSANYIYDLENKEKRKHKHLKYNPKIGFGGSRTECFIKLIS